MKPYYPTINSVGAAVARKVAREWSMSIDPSVTDERISELMRYISNKANSMQVQLRIDQLLDCTFHYLMYTKEASFYGTDFAEKNLLNQIERFGSAA